jgi:universal stress protein A
MTDIKRILVASMSTAHCLNAVQWGICFAKNHNAKLFIVHIIHNPFGLEGWNLPIPSIKTMEEEFSKMTQQAKKSIDQYVKSENTTGLSIEEQIIEGNPMEKISEFIKDNQIDLLIMTAHEQNHIEHFISGHEIRDLVREMPCSIFLARRELEYKHFND